VKRVLVTGGSGFIGSHVVDALAAADIRPCIYDLRPSPYHDGDATDLVVADLLDADALAAAMHGCDAVIHLAAAADVTTIVDHPAAAEQVNARGTLAVLETARATAVRSVVYCSTIWVYDSPDGVVTEDTPLRLPRHIYTASKLAGEMYCTSYAELYGLPCTILRLGIPYGPRARPTAVIPVFVRRALAGEPLTLAGGGWQTRRFVYVEDLADGVVRALAPRASNRVYNLVGDESVTIRAVAEAVAREVGDIEVALAPGRDGEFSGAEISGARAAEELGWRPTTSLGEGISRYVAWMREGGSEESWRRSTSR
jgi:UDP-glucose 4-epimerase